MQLLDIFPQGVEEIEGGFAVYTDDGGERALRDRFDVTSEPVAEGWEDAWRDFHHGVTIGRFWVGPPWEEPPAGALAVVVDPGRAFGTGAHPTTRLCLELLLDQPRASVLDLGCGSGVLAIAACLLGHAPVTAVDLAEASIEATRSNAAANGVALTATLLDATTAALPAAGLALANIAPAAVAAIAPGLTATRLIASGYPPSEPLALDRYRRRERRELDGWAADLFELG